MDHVRKQIRDCVAQGLAGLLTTGDRVYSGRTRPLKADHEPTLLIYTRNETSVRDAHGRPPILARSVVLHIEGRVSTAEPPDDLLDQIAAEIEVGIAAMIDYGTGKVLGGLVQNIQFQATEVIAEAQGERHIGAIRLEYLVKYRANEGAPFAAI